MIYNPELDGIEHINVYSKGKTELGRILTNFAKFEINTEDGKFNSVEGYWYWLSCKDDHLRKLYGFEAKKYGRSVGAKDWMDNEEFKEKILKAIKYKINHLSENLHFEFIYSSFPFVHYYNFGGKIIVPNDGYWILDFLNNYREELNIAF